MSNKAALLLGSLSLAGCEAPPQKSTFPDPARPVAPIVSARYSNEDARDSAGEFETVGRLAGGRPGMWSGGVGAGGG